MRKRLAYVFAPILVILTVLVVWQGSFRMFGPTNPQQTVIFWFISSLTFILMVTLGWRPGPAIGRALAVLEEKQMLGALRNQNEALAWAARVVEEGGKA